jgi:hypothetical protein
MLDTKHYIYFETALKTLVKYMAADPYTLRTRGGFSLKEGQAIIESFIGMGIIDEEHNLICFDIDTQLGIFFIKKADFIVPDYEKIKDENMHDAEGIIFFERFKYSTEFVLKEIFPKFRKVIEWWNSNTSKYNQNLTEKYYPNKKWSSLSEKKVFELYLKEIKVTNIDL